MIDRRFFGCVAINTFTTALIQIQLFIPVTHLLSIAISLFSHLQKKINHALLVPIRMAKAVIEETEKGHLLRICF